MRLTNSRLRVSLRSVLIGFTLCALTFAYFAYDARQRTAAVRAIEEAGGSVKVSPGSHSWIRGLFYTDRAGSVQKVDLRKGKFDDVLISHIAVLTELRELDLSGTPIDDKGIERISHLPLRKLWLQSTRITDASAASLSKVSTLDFLQLNGTAVTDEFLKQLTCMPDLENLGLRGTQVTDAGMTHLSQHLRLKTLDLYQTNVSDSGVKELVKCKQLSDVGLSMTKITERVFVHLNALRNLTSADLNANAISTEAVLEFERTHPKCDIEWYQK